MSAASQTRANPLVQTRAAGAATPPEPFAAARPDSSKASARHMIEAAVRRLSDVLDDENEALTTGGGADLKAFNERKSLGLIELNRALRLFDGAEADHGTLDLLERLNDKLSDNRRVLTVHLQAVREVAGIISQSIRDAESDGTYTLAFRSKGQTP